MIDPSKLLGVCLSSAVSIDLLGKLRRIGFINHSQTLHCMPNRSADGVTEEMKESKQFPDVRILFVSI